MNAKALYSFPIFAFVFLQLIRVDSNPGKDENLSKGSLGSDHLHKNVSFFSQENFIIIQ